MSKHRKTIVRRTAEQFQVSTIGIGTYLGAADDATDAAMERCLLAALRAGVNVIDTSPIYRGERSETVVGRTLAAAMAEGIPREEVVLCTKVGVLPYQREPPRDPVSYYRTRFVESGLLKPEWIYDGQCFHPDYIAWQLGESLRRLNTGWVDIYYLHNPESLGLSLAPAEVEGVLRSAMRRIAGFCREGTVRYAGLSTWDAFVTEAGPERLSLGDVTRWAEEEGLADFFRFIQLPVSLAMPAALSTPTQEYEGRRWSAIRLARHLKLAVFASAPFMNGTLLREPLPPEVARAFPDARTDAQRCLEFSRSSPGVATSLVGTTNVEHLQEILEVAARPPMSEAAFAEAFG